MFIAIIVAHYNQFRRESRDENEKISFFEVIMKILAANMCKKKNQGKKNSKDSETSSEKEKCSWLRKIFASKEPEK